MLHNLRTPCTPGHDVARRQHDRVFHLESSRGFTAFTLGSYVTVTVRLLITPTCSCNYSFCSNTADNPDVYVDLAHVLSSCTEVVSAEVPNAVREVAKSIDNISTFRTLTDEQALDYLRSGKEPKATAEFHDLLEKHGHRGFKEFDPAVKQWAQDPLPLVKSIKVSDVSAHLEHLYCLEDK